MSATSNKYSNLPFELPKVTFGAWPLGGWDWGGCSDDEGISAVHGAIDEGITCIDTAPVYGLGHSEEVVGKALEGKRDKVILATKCGFRWDEGEGKSWDKISPAGEKATIRHRLTEKSIRLEIEESLRRLQTEYIDLYQCHAPDPDTPLEETMSVLMDLKGEGKIRAFGVSNFSIEQMKRCCELAPVATSQSMYNLILRDIDQDIRPFCIEQGVGILTYTSMLLGLLTGKVSMEREFPEGDLRKGHHLFTPEWRRGVLDMLESFRDIADKHQASFAQLVVAWVFHTPGISSALVGIRSPAQAKENAHAMRISLTDEEYTTMTSGADRLRDKLLK